MKKNLLCLLSLGSFAFAQEGAIPEPDQLPGKDTPQFVLDLQGLSKEDTKKYGDHFMRADQLFKQKRIFECLEELYQLEQIYAKNPATLNLKGACYVEFRNFAKARRAFEKALKANSGNFNVLFNLAEIEFVTQNYRKCLEMLKEIKSDMEGKKGSDKMVPLIEFKMLLCMLKLDDEAGARAIVAKKDFLDDSPLFYYGNAALEYHQDNGPEAEVWLARAARIFRNPGTVAPWQDTLIEFGYIKSFYGGDLEVTPAGGKE